MEADKRRVTLKKQFLSHLEALRSEFRWYVDSGWLRARHKDEIVCFCPFTACYFDAYGEAIISSRVHEVAKKLGWEEISYEVVDAVDGRLDTPLGREICKAVGARV